MKRIIVILVIAFLCTGLMQAQTKILGRKVFDRGIQSHTFIPKGQWPKKISSYRRMKYPPGFRILTLGSVWLRTMLIPHCQMRILYGKQATSSLRKNLLVENIFIINPWRRLFLLMCSRYTWKLF